MKTPPRSPSPLSFAREELTKKKNQNSLIESFKISWSDLLESKGILVGECHSDASSKRFLIDNMRLLSEKGYTTIFLEHIGEEYQSDLAEALKSKTLSKKLQDKLSHLDEGHMLIYPSSEAICYDKNKEKYSFTELVKAAINNNIEIVPLEKSDEKWKEESKSADGGRIAIFNNRVVDIISKKAENNDKLKWLGLVGSGHLRSYKNCEGIADFLQCVDVLISDIGMEVDVRKKEISDNKISATNQNIVAASICVTWDPTESMQYSDMCSFYTESLNKTSRYQETPRPQVLFGVNPLNRKRKLAANLDSSAENNVTK